MKSNSENKFNLQYDETQSVFVAGTAITFDCEEPTEKDEKAP